MDDKQSQSPRVSQVSTMAIVSLVLSVSGILIGPFGFLPGIVCGHFALRRIRKGQTLAGKGIAVAAVTVGYLLLAATIAIALLMPVQDSGEESRMKESHGKGPAVTSSTQ